MKAKIRAHLDYLSGGVACGLGGIVLFGIPVIIVSVLSDELRTWIALHGGPTLGFPEPFWSKLISPAQWNRVFGSLIYVIVPAVSIAGGFVYGWRVGMHWDSQKLNTIALHGPPLS